MTPSRLLAPLLLALAAIPAAAEEPPRASLVVRAGAYLPRAADVTDLGFGNGFAGEVAFGWRATEELGLQVGVGQFRASTPERAPSGVSIPELRVKDELTVTPVTASLLLLVPAGPLQLYGIVGAGAYFATVTERASLTGGGSAGTTTEHATAPGAHIGLGGTVGLGSHASVGLDARWVVVRASLDALGGGVALDGLQVTGVVAWGF